MTVSTRTLAAATLSILAGAPAPAFASDLDATLEPKQRFDGRIAWQEDVDVVSYGAIGGTELSVVVAAKGGSKVLPRVAVKKDGVTLAPQQSLVLQGGREQRRLRYPIAIGGDVSIEIRAEDGSIGAYRLKVRERIATEHDWKASLAPGGLKWFEFPARAGTVATLTVERVSAGSEPLVIPKLVTPGGQELVLDGFVSAEDGALGIGPFDLAEDGVYRVALVAAENEEKLAAHLALAPIPIAPGTQVEAPGEVSVDGALVLKGGDWLDAESEGSEYLADELIVRLRAGADAVRVATALGVELVDVSPRGFARLRIPGVPAGRVAGASEKRRIAALGLSARQVAGVIAAEPNHLRRELAVPNDSLFSQQWGYVLSGFPRAAELSPGDAARTIAVLDTGVRFEHPDLASKFSAGYDFVSDTWNSGDGNGLDSDATDVLVAQGTHGTHVSGIIIAQNDNSLGIAGAARLGRVMPLRVLGVLGGTDHDIAQAVLYAARLPNASGFLPAQRAEVINMSLGGPSPSIELDDAVREAIAAGVVVVAAAGNSNSKTKMYPAAIDGVIAVAATDRLDQKAYYSSFGNHVDLSAPGGDPYADLDGDGWKDGIVSTIVVPLGGPTWGNKSGTSMASPHVAAAAFLLRAVRPTLSPLEVEAWLCASALDLGAEGKDKFFGYGRLDAGRALDCLLGSDAGPKELFALPSEVVFDVGLDQRDVALVDTGAGGPLTIAAATPAAFWLAADGEPGAVPRTYSLTVDRSGLLAGTYQTTLDLDTSIGPRSIQVEVVVPPSGSPPLVKTVHVFAIDVATHSVAAVASFEHADALDFELPVLPEGTYRFCAATDLDLDGIAGEDHDFAGVATAADGTTFALKDGESLSGLVLMLAIGNAADLPWGGELPVVP